jgi:hypothetical protein
MKRAADRDHNVNLLHLRGVLLEEAKIGQLILAHIHVCSVEGEVGQKDARPRAGMNQISFPIG